MCFRPAHSRGVLQAACRNVFASLAERSRHMGTLSWTFSRHVQRASRSRPGTSEKSEQLSARPLAASGASQHEVALRASFLEVLLFATSNAAARAGKRRAGQAWGRRRPCQPKGRHLPGMGLALTSHGVGDSQPGQVPAATRRADRPHRSHVTRHRHSARARPCRCLGWPGTPRSAQVLDRGRGPGAHTTH